MSFFAKRLTVSVYLKAGQTVVLENVKRFTATRNGTGLHSIEWEFEAGAAQEILSLNPDEIAAIITDKR